MEGSRLRPIIASAAAAFAGWLLSCGAISSAWATTGTPAGGFIAFSLAPNTQSEPIPLPFNVPSVVTATTTTVGYRGVAIVSVLRIQGSFLEWTGINSPSGGTLTSGFGGTGTVIGNVDFDNKVDLVVVNNDQLVVYNDSSETREGYVTWTYADTNTLNNTALGNDVLGAVTTGNANTGVGTQALFGITTGHDNTAVGFQALWGTTTGQQNMAVGRNALRNNTTGSFNSAMGYSSCWSCRTGSNNVAYGFKSLYNLNNGSGNIAIGPQAGVNITASNNIDIGNQGITGDNGIIRIGAPSTQTKAFIAGITGTQLTGAAVYVNASGQLGVLASSERYKTAITSMGDEAAKLDRLRPVTFHLKNEPKGALQYGLIAEEVERVYPELVIRDATGKIQGVRYDELAPILVKDAQNSRQALQAERQALQLERQERLADRAQTQRQLAELKRQNDALQATLLRLQGADTRVARR